MAQNKKKTKTPAGQPSRKVAKKAVKAKTKKRVTAATKKKTKNPVARKTSRITAGKAKSSVKKLQARKPETENVPKEVAIPEAIKQNEATPPAPPENTGMSPDTMEKNKISEHQFEHRTDAMMNQENQRVKSSLANRRATRRVFHTQRHT